MWHRASWAGVALFVCACGGGGGGGGGDPAPPFVEGPVTRIDGVFPQSVSVGFADGDANRDLLIFGILELGPVVPDVGVAVWTGDGDGTFASARTTTNGLPPFGEQLSPVPGYFDLDGHLDLAVLSPFQFGVLLGDGDGGFDPGRATLGDFAPGDLALDAARFEGNGDLLDDVVFGTYGGRVGLLQSDGTGGLLIVALIVTTTHHVIDVQVADVNGDGQDDVMALDDDSTLTVVFGDGAGGFLLGPSIEVGLAGDVEGFALGDFDTAYGIDLAVTRTPLVIGSDPFVSVTFYSGDGSGGFGPITGAVEIAQEKIGRPEALGIGAGPGLVVLAGAAASPPGGGPYNVLYRVVTDDAGVPTVTLIELPSDFHPLLLSVADVDGDVAGDVVVLGVDLDDPSPVALEIRVLFGVLQL